tara:strand:+ start:16 stop:396 length:381 start_codon:yes stop_codon:yes gene_type:complete
MKKLFNIIIYSFILILTACTVQTTYNIPLESNNLSQDDMTKIFNIAYKKVFNEIKKDETLSKLLDNKINFESEMNWKDPVGKDKYYYFDFYFLPDNSGNKISKLDQEKIITLWRKYIKEAETTFNK